MRFREWLEIQEGKKSPKPDYSVDDFIRSAQKFQRDVQSYLKQYGKDDKDLDKKIKDAKSKKEKQEKDDARKKQQDEKKQKKSPTPKKTKQDDNTEQMPSWVGKPRDWVGQEKKELQDADGDSGKSKRPQPRGPRKNKS